MRFCHLSHTLSNCSKRFLLAHDRRSSEKLITLAVSVEQKYKAKERDCIFCQFSCVRRAPTNKCDFVSTVLDVRSHKYAKPLLLFICQRLAESGLACGSWQIKKRKEPFESRRRRFECQIYLWALASGFFAIKDEIQRENSIFRWITDRMGGYRALTWVLMKARQSIVPEGVFGRPGLNSSNSRNFPTFYGKWEETHQKFGWQESSVFDLDSCMLSW